MIVSLISVNLHISGKKGELLFYGTGTSEVEGSVFHPESSLREKVRCLADAAVCMDLQHMVIGGMGKISGQIKVGVIGQIQIGVPIRQGFVFYGEPVIFGEGINYF